MHHPHPIPLPLLLPELKEPLLQAERQPGWLDLPLLEEVLGEAGEEGTLLTGTCSLGMEESR
jgi:hypothetical protein